MRVDGFGLRTGVLAGAALVLLCIAVLGPKTSIDLLPDVARLVPELPALGSSDRTHAKSPHQYAEITARPLFSADRQLHPFFIDTGTQPPAQAATFDFILTGVLRTRDLQVAMVRPDPAAASINVRLGGEVPTAPGWRLVDLQPRSAVFAGGQGRITLELQTFDGVGGYAAAAQATDAQLPPVAATVKTTMPTAEGSPAGASRQVATLRDRIEARRAALRAEASGVP